MIRTAVIFDMDGVLVDTEPSFFKSNNALFRELGFSVPVEDYAAFVGSSSKNVWSTIKDRFHLPQSVEELVALSYRSHMSSLTALDVLDPIPGIRELLKSLSARAIPFGLASSSPRAVIEYTLEKARIARYFPVRVSGDEVAHGKPQPDIFLLAASRLGVTPDRCLVVEDSPHGIAGAVAAGMKTVLFAHPHSGNDGSPRANLVIHSFAASERDGIFRLLNTLAHG